MPSTKTPFDVPAIASPPLYVERNSPSCCLTVRDVTRLAVSVTLAARDGKAIEARFPVLWPHTLQTIDRPSLTRNGQAKAPADFAAPCRDDFTLAELMAHDDAVATGARRDMAASGPVVDVDHDLLLTAVGWIEKQPQSISAVKVKNIRIMRGLPLCPCPQMARYTGSGDLKSASNLVRG
jgi:hypothetical protein